MLQGIGPASRLGSMLHPIWKVSRNDMGFRLPEKGRGFHRISTGQPEKTAITRTEMIFCVRKNKFSQGHGLPGSGFGPLMLFMLQFMKLKILFNLFGQIDMC